jgi:hypothetical protein
MERNGRRSIENRVQGQPQGFTLPCLVGVMAINNCIKFRPTINEAAEGAQEGLGDDRVICDSAVLLLIAYVSLSQMCSLQNVWVRGGYSSTKRQNGIAEEWEASWVQMNGWSGIAGGRRRSM